MSTLYIHIGTHKTGTSTIQRYFNSMASRFRKQGILQYPESGRPDIAPDGHHLLAWSLSKFIQKKRGDYDKSSWADLLREIEADNMATIFISAEGLCYLTEEEIDELASMIKEFDSKVIIYLRNQLSFMASDYKQQIKSGTQAETFRKYLEKNINRCNYLYLVQKWSNVFGQFKCDHQNVR